MAEERDFNRNLFDLKEESDVMETSSFDINDGGDDTCSIMDASNAFRQDRNRKRKPLTIPKTPLLMKHQPKFQRGSHLTAEERELAQIKELKAQLAKKKLEAAKERRRSSEAQKSMSQSFKKPLRKANGFNFATDNRVKEVNFNNDFETVDFVKTLRKQENFNFNPTRTRPEPFVFNGKETAKDNKPVEKIETFAEKCANFTSKTPVRFRTKPRKETEKQTNYFAFQNENSNDNQFRAKPLDHRILEGPVGLKARKPNPVTIPHSPSFSKLHTTRKIELNLEDSTMTGVPKICQLPASTSPFKPQLERRKLESIPFSFETRDKQMMKKKEEKIKKVFKAEKEAREFYAHPLPSLETVLPAKRMKPITVPEAFDLEIEKRVSIQHEKWQKKLEEERKLEKEKSTFHARRATVLEMQPFVPDKPSFRLDHSTMDVAKHVPLHTERRVAAWKDKEKYLQEKQAEMEEINARRELQRIEEETEEVKKIREQAVHKARPIRNYKPVFLEPSSKPLTAPQTPKFSRRLTQRFNNKM